RHESQHSIQSVHMRWRIATSGWRMAAAVFVATVTVGAQQRVPEPAAAAAARVETLRPEILGTHGIVAAGRHYSVSAGVRIMQQGGKAIDPGAATDFAARFLEM